LLNFYSIISGYSGKIKRLHDCDLTQNLAICGLLIVQKDYLFYFGIMFYTIRRKLLCGLGSFFLLGLMLNSGISQGSEKQQIKIAYLSKEQSAPSALSNLDPFIKNKGYPGAMLAIEDNNTTGQFTGQEYILQPFIVGLKASSKQMLKDILAQGYELVIVNLPADALQKLLDELLVQPVLLFDIGTQDDHFRAQKCNTQVLHLLPSRAMKTDALAQYMLKKRWKKWFLVEGSAPGDRLYAQAIKRSAKKFGIKIVAEKVWQHNFDARRTAQSEVPVFTQGKDYDVLVVADEQGLFGEYLEYRTWKPRPVAGTQGLVPTAWHRTHEQWGAVQIQKRFKKQIGRWMLEQDYAAYLAVRAIGEAATRTQSTHMQPIKEYLLGEQFALQGYKGKPLSFRSWNGQLRQPVLLASARSLVSVAPIDGFLHPETELDTLGYDQAETQCQ
jgi:ABC transporter substrate binding protein (PQQ-dependent alcohol dehydrogenase system)